MNTQPKGHTLITGAVGGLGTAMVHRLLCEGYRIGEAAVWLCSDEASFVTGLPIAVDGGMWAQ